MNINAHRQAVSVIADAYGVGDDDVTTTLAGLIEDSSITADDILELVTDAIYAGANIIRAQPHAVLA